jgi:hypothetical protein
VRKSLILALSLLLSTSQNVYAAKVTPGSTCKKPNIQEVYKGKIYTCIKLGKKLYWSNGVKYTTNPVTPNPVPSKVNPTPTPTPTPIQTAVKPGKMTNISAQWEELTDGPTLKVTFDFDFSQAANLNVTNFQYYLTSGQTRSSLIVVLFKYLENLNNFGPFKSSFAVFEISAADNFGNFGEWASLSSIPAYSPDLCVPAIRAISITNGYSVEDTSGCIKPFEFFSIEEVVSNATGVPTGGWQQIYLDKPVPARVLTASTEVRWIRARYVSKVGVYGNYSNAVRVTPSPVVTVDLTPPNEVSNASGSWVGDNLMIQFTLPPIDAGVSFRIVLTTPNGVSGIFSAVPVGTSANQTVALSKADVRAQFGSLSMTYKGLIRSVDAAGNVSKGTNFVVS